MEFQILARPATVARVWRAMNQILPESWNFKNLVSHGWNSASISEFQEFQEFGKPWLTEIHGIILNSEFQEFGMDFGIY